MKWYSDQLLLHGERLCKIAVSIFNTSRPPRCTHRYHSTHPSSPLNPMSLVSDLASALRRPDQHSSSQQPTQGLTECQSAPLHQHSAAQGGPLPTGLEASSKPPTEPLTPASVSAPNPSSWPQAQQQMAQSPDQAGQEELQFSSSLQPSEPPQLATDSAQPTSVLDSQSAASSSSSKAEAAASQIGTCSEGSLDAAAGLNKYPVLSSPGQPDSLRFAPPKGPALSSTDEPEAVTAKSAPNRCISMCILTAAQVVVVAAHL